jgi:hypothetical protein
MTYSTMNIYDDILHKRSNRIDCISDISRFYGYGISDIIVSFVLPYKTLRWNIYKYNSVSWEINRIMNFIKDYDISIKTYLKFVSQGDFRKYFIKNHFLKMRRCLRELTGRYIVLPPKNTIYNSYSFSRY